MKKRNISVVIPTFNEATILPKTIQKLKTYLQMKKWDYEIIVIDDGSSDDTPKVAKENNVTILRNSRNIGKGYSVRKGVEEAEKDLILFVDADLSIPIRELENFTPFLKNYDIVIGSKNLETSTNLIKRSPLRQFFSKTFSALVKILILKDFQDTQCGFKLFKKGVAKKIFSIQKIKGFCFDVETLLIAKNLELKVKEVGVKSFTTRPASKIRIVKDSLIMFSDLFRIKVYNFRGLYHHKP